jgi:hypothetical protein
MKTHRMTISLNTSRPFLNNLKSYSLHDFKLNNKFQYTPITNLSGFNIFQASFL